MVAERDYSCSVESQSKVSEHKRFESKLSPFSSGHVIAMFASADDVLRHSCHSPWRDLGKYASQLLSVRVVLFPCSFFAKI